MRRRPTRKAAVTADQWDHWRAARVRQRFGFGPGGAFKNRKAWRADVEALEAEVRKHGIEPLELGGLSWHGASEPRR